MLLCDLVIVINHFLPRRVLSVSSSTAWLAVSSMTDLIFCPGQALLIIIPDLISRRDYLEVKNTNFSYYSFGFIEDTGLYYPVNSASERFLLKGS